MTGQRLGVLGAWIVAAAFLPPSAVRAIDIELTYGPGLADIFDSDPVLYGKIVTAADLAATSWEDLLHDPITVKFEVDVAMGLPAPVLGFFAVNAPGITGAFPYMGIPGVGVTGSLLADITSTSDLSAVSSLQLAPFVDMITNDTTSFGAARIRIGTPEIYNSTLRLTRANQKALGLLGATDGAAGADGKLVISSSKLGVFDYFPGDGIDPMKLDAVAVFAHEFAHGLGFIGGVDHIDAASNPIGFPGPDFPTDYSDETIFTPLDLYRYSADSMSKPMQPPGSGVLDWAFSASGPGFPLNPYFSIDGGDTKLAVFSTGAFNGDGHQAQHWKDDDFLGGPIGLMDPELASGETLAISPMDLLAMDVIGYNLVAVPEPATLGLACIGLLMLALWLGGNEGSALDRWLSCSRDVLRLRKESPPEGLP